MPGCEEGTVELSNFVSLVSPAPWRWGQHPIWKEKMRWKQGSTVKIWQEEGPALLVPKHFYFFISSSCLFVLFLVKLVGILFLSLAMKSSNCYRHEKRNSFSQQSWEKAINSPILKTEKLRLRSCSSYSAPCGRRGLWASSLHGHSTGPSVAYNMGGNQQTETLKAGGWAVDIDGKHVSPAKHCTC